MKLASFLSVLSLARGLRGVMLRPPTSSVVPERSQRSAVAFGDRYSDTYLPLPNLDTQDFTNPSTSFSMPNQITSNNNGSKESTDSDSKASFSSLTTELWGEAFGTFLIVGVGSIASMTATFVDPFTQMPLPEIALARSAAVASAIALCSSQQWGEAHFNPAVTLVAALFRGLAWSKVLPYSLAQITGATMGSAVAYALDAPAIQQFEAHQQIVRAGCKETARLFGEYFDPSLNLAQAFGVEAFGTAILVAMGFVLKHPKMAAATKQRHLVMGVTMFTLIDWLAPYTQAGMNPARDFGPRVVAYAAGWTDVAFQNCSLYLAAPFVGATVGAGMVEAIMGASTTQHKQQ